MKSAFLFLIALPAFTPAAHAQSWVTNDYYPEQALREGRQGTSFFQLSISAEGKVTNCAITQSSGWQDLDDAACANMMRRARFKPATGADGQPRADTFNGRFAWKIPQ